MQTLRRAAAVLVYPAVLFFAIACERSNAPPTSPSARAPRADLVTPTTSDATDWLARALSLGELLADDPRMTAWTDEAEADDNDPIKVVPFEFDPFKTYLVRSRWLRGTGCPTEATINTGSPGSFTDAACPDGDSKDNKNEGLLLVKTGPTGNIAAPGAEVKGVNGMPLNELGYDIRKGLLAVNPAGSHCGGGAPRFNVVVQGDPTIHFIGCNSPPASVGGSSNAWLRLRWTAAQFALATPPIPPGAVIQSLAIVFDEGQDTGPDFIGLAILDNIDVNGRLVGQGPGN